MGFEEALVAPRSPAVQSLCRKSDWLDSERIPEIAQRVRVKYVTVFPAKIYSLNAENLRLCDYCCRSL